LAETHCHEFLYCTKIIQGELQLPNNTENLKDCSDEDEKERESTILQQMLGLHNEEQDHYIWRF
jgi:hypothetical protein